jgi:hypothetical protein
MYFDPEIGKKAYQAISPLSNLLLRSLDHGSHLLPLPSTIVYTTLDLILMVHILK